MAKAFVYALLDVGVSMLEPINADDRAPSKLSVGATFVRYQVTQMVLAGKTSEIGFALYGSSKTDNALNEERGGFENVEEILQIGRPSAESVEFLAEKVVPGEDSSDLLDALDVGQEALSNTKEGKNNYRILLVVTDGKTAISRFDYLEKNLLNRLIDSNCRLFIGLLGSSDGSAVKKENAKLFQDLAVNTGGKLVTASCLGDLFHLLASAPGLTTSPRPTKISLEISPTLRIPCSYWGEVSKTTLPSLKKQARISPAPAAGQRKAAVVEDDEEDGGGAVKRDTSYRNPDDPDEEILSEDRVKGYKYGSQYVPITSAEEESFKIPGPAIVELLGFLPASKVPRQHYLEATVILQGDPSLDSALVAVASLVRAMRERNQIGLARFVKRENGDPFLAALVPHDDVKAVSWVVVRLPCCEDYRDYSFPSLLTDVYTPGNSKFSASAAEQYDAISRFVDLLTVQNPAPAMMTPFNPTLKQVVAAISHKIVHTKGDKESDEDSLVPTASFLDPLHASLRMMSQRTAVPVITLEAALKRISDLFPLQVKEKSKDKKRSYWSEIDVQTDSSSVKSRRGIAEITIKEDGASQAVVDSGPKFEAPVLSAGSVNPVEDFEALVEKCLDPKLPPEHMLKAEESMKSAMDTMGDIVTKMVTVGATNAHYRKALTCIKAYRKAAILTGEHARYNAFLRSVKASHSSGRHKAFWSSLVDFNPTLTLICSSDDSGSSVSPAEAAAFFKEAAKVVVEEVKKPVVQEEEDLFGEME